MQKIGFDPWSRKITYRKQRHPTPVFLPGEPQGLRSLASYSPCSRKESDTTGQLTYTHTHTMKIIFKEKQLN